MLLKMAMTVYAGDDRNSELVRDVTDLNCGAGEIACIECGGDGNWGKFAPEIVGEDFACPVCKGTGRQLVSI